MFLRRLMFAQTESKSELKMLNLNKIEINKPHSTNLHSNINDKSSKVRFESSVSEVFYEVSVSEHCARVRNGNLKQNPLTEAIHTWIMNNNRKCQQKGYISNLIVRHRL